MSLLTDTEVAAGLSGLPEWSGDTSALRREAVYADFAAALQAVNRVGDVAEAMNHHPDIDIRWNRVVLTVSTHSEGGVTAADLELAQRLEAVLPAGAA